MSGFHLFIKSWWLLIPIGMCSIISAAVIIERFFSLRKAKIDSRYLMNNIRQILARDRIREALELCDRTGSPLAHILRAGIMKHDRDKEEIHQAIEDAGRMVIPSLERYLGTLGTIANVAPLLGLLGTVFGMIEAFWVIQQKMGAVNPGDLAGGIGGALHTTAWGLVVGIPTLVAYNYFVTQVDSMIVEMEILSSELVDLLSQKHTPPVQGQEDYEAQADHYPAEAGSNP